MKQVTRRQDGAVLVEFALVLVPLLFLVFGFLQFGVAMNNKIDATHLTAEGARYIAVNQNPGLPSATPSAAMASYILSKGDTAQVQAGTVSICYPTNPQTGTSGKIGDPVKVKLTPTTFAVFSNLPLIGRSGGLTLPLPIPSSETTMRLEAVPTNIPTEVGSCP